MLQRRAADAHPSPGAWEAITSRLGEPEAATVLPFRRSEGRRRALVGAAAAALVVVVGVGAFALAARDGEPADVVAGPPDQDQPVTTVTIAPVPSGTPLRGVWPVATEEALRDFAEANPFVTDPVQTAATYLADRLTDADGEPISAQLSDLQQGDSQSGEVQYTYGEGAGGSVHLRRLGGEGSPWYVVAAATDLLLFEVASAGGDPFIQLTTADPGELAYEIDEDGVTVEGERSPVIDGPVVVDARARSGPVTFRARLFDETGALAAFIEVRTDPGALDPGGTPDDEVAAPEMTTVPPSATTSTTSPVEDGAAVGETTVVLESDGLGFLGAGDDTTISHLGFGIDQDGVLAALTATLGEPLELGTNEECPPGPAQVAQFVDGFMATFQDGAFVGWAVGEPSTITTAAGIGFGSTLADVQAAYAGITVEETSLGWELTGGDLYGIVSGPDRDATVENLFGGANCVFR